MRTLKVRASQSRSRYALVPTSWAEGYDMIEKTMEAGLTNGNDSSLASVCERVVFGMLGEKYHAPNQRTALAYLVMEICKREGAGL